MKKYVKSTSFKERFADVLSVLEFIVVDIIWVIVWFILRFLVEISFLIMLGIIIVILAVIDVALSPLVFVVWLLSGYTYYPALCKRFSSSVKDISGGIFDRWVN